MSIEQKIAEILAESNATQFSEEIEEEFEDLEELEEEELKPEDDGEEPHNKKNNVKGNPQGKKAVKEDVDGILEDLNLQEATIEEIEDFMMSEDFEQLDELSKKTLASYINHAKADVYDNIRTGQDNNSSHLVAAANKQRNKGIRLATKRLAKEEYDLDISEDVAALTNGEELSEEFKAKAATIFEAAVINRVKQEVATLEEEFDARLEEAVAQTQEALVEKVDGYLNYVVETWMVDNELALERGMKSEILESFVSGMKGLFEEHYIDVPEERFDLIGEMEEAIESLNGKLDEQLAVNVEMKKLLDEAARVEIVSESCEGLTDTEKEKFVSLVEELSYENSETFEKKVQTIRENYFTNKATTRSSISSVVTDEPVSLNEEKVIPAGMKRYVQALNNLK